MYEQDDQNLPMPDFRATSIECNLDYDKMATDSKLS